MKSVREGPATPRPGAGPATRRSPGRLPAGPLTPDHARQVEALLGTLSPEEALWISGYLAAVGLDARAGLPGRPPDAPAAAGGITILYGSETGHAAGIAGRMGEQAREQGLAARVVGMAEFRPQGLKDITHLAVVTSTHGDGAPPDPAAGFYEFLWGRKAPRLPGTAFAVLGLGDSTYEHFCKAAADIDRRLEELGARRLHARVDCDVDYEDQAAAWVRATLMSFAQDRAAAGNGAPARPGAGIAVAAPAATLRDGAAPARDRWNPFPAAVVEALLLNGRGSDEETRHIELLLEGSALDYEPGDSLGVVPENDPALVEELIAALGVGADDPVPGRRGEAALVDALARDYEITTLTPRFIARYADAAQAAPLRALSGAEHRADFTAYVAGRQIVDVVTEFPAKGLPGDVFVSMLRKLEPRLYSLASSRAVYPGEAHLTVAAVRYDGRRRAHKGVASCYLVERRAPGETVPVYVERNPHFRLPPDGATPIVMVGAGTGVAPFRAFVQERQAAGAAGRSWLFFGDRRFRTDFLYQAEWQRLLKEGALSRMDVAFSRDQAEKVYVQHRLLERGREVYAWLEDGAYLYVCGDATRLAPGVHEALLAVVERERGRGRTEAEEYVRDLERDARYQRDVY